MCFPPNIWARISPSWIVPARSNFWPTRLNVLPAIDAAVVVCEPEPAKVQMLQPYLKALSDAKIPHYLFVNKIDKASGSLRELLALLQEASETPLLLRQIPDLGKWRRHRLCRSGAGAGLCLSPPRRHREVVDIADLRREKEARFQMLERLADYDEHLMEELLGDVEPAARGSDRRSARANWRRAWWCRC